MGALIKTYFAKKINRAPEDIVVVSIMPCVAKKDERARPQLTMQIGSKKLPETDYVLTTREIGHLLQNENVRSFRSFFSLKSLTLLSPDSFGVDA